MTKHNFTGALTRRDVLRLSTTAATALAAKQAFPALTSATAQAASKPANLYSQLLQTWCDGLIEHQLPINNPAFQGGLLCPACVLIHGRVGDAVYPLLRVAHTTGNSKYLQAALLVHEWSERMVSRSDGSWVNDVNLSSWKGITVFHAISLAEALHHHGTILDAATRQRWTDRLARAAKFLDPFISIETGNINYPVTASYCFAICGQVLGDHHYLDRAHTLAHTALDYFTPTGLLYGEGHPLKKLSPKHCHPVDLGYNVEESLPALASTPSSPTTNPSSIKPSPPSAPTWSSCSPTAPGTTPGAPATTSGAGGAAAPATAVIPPTSSSPTTSPASAK